MAKGVEDNAFYRDLAPHLAERGRWRPERVLAVGRGVPRAMAARQHEWPDAMTTHDDPRHQAQRGHPRPDHRPGRGARRMGRVPRTGCSRSRRCPTPASRTCSGRPSSAPGRSPASGSTPTPRRRCARPASTPLDRRRTRRSRRPSTPRSTRRTTTPQCATVLAGAGRPDRRPGGATPSRPSCVAMTMPGVPDVYQGTELWELSLVDPDNRRPVDFVRRGVLARVLGGERPVLTTAPTTLATPSSSSPRPRSRCAATAAISSRRTRR